MINLIDNFVNTFTQPVSVVTTSSEIVSANSATKQFMGFQANESVEGLCYSDMRCDAANFAADYILQDQQVLKNRSLKFISLYKISDKEYHCLLGRKSLMFDDNYILSSYEDLTALISPSALEQIIEYAPPSERLRTEKQFWFELSEPSDAAPLLSVRENQCLQLLANGSNAKQIAQLLGLSPRTIEKYIETIKSKLQCHSTAQVVPVSVRKGILPLTSLVFK